MIPKSEMLGFGLQVQSIESEHEVIAIFDQHVRLITQELGDPDYAGIGPWSGYDREPPARVVTPDYAQAIRFAIWN